MMMLFAIFSTMILLFSCVSNPVDPPLLPELVAPGDLPEDYRRMAVEALKIVLVDPGSLRDLEFRPPVIYTIPVNMTDSSLKKNMQVWQIGIFYRAKNRFGGYTGLQYSVVWIRYGRVIAVI